jgi:Asp-tRNA(Asn)/Glu-tRNA(Gln) amidotransferase C subunit
MPDLTHAQVQTLAQAAGLAITDPEDLEEVTHRLNALLEALATLEDLPLGPLDQVQAIPTLQHPERLP